MKLTYNDAVQCYADYMQSKEITKNYELEISNDLIRPSALDAVSILEDGVDLSRRAEFVRRLLMGNTVTVRLEGTEVCSFLVNEGFQWFAVDALNKQPAALQFILSSVYGLFLKNCMPPLTTSSQSVAETITNK